RLPTPKTTRRVETAPFELVYVDLSGEIRPPGPRGEHYICLFTCGFTTYRWAYMIALKSDAVKALALFVDEVKALGFGVRRLRSDNGGEFVGRAFTQACIDNGIKQEFAPPYTPEYMGKAERGWGVIGGPTRALLAASNVEKRFWTEAFQCAVHLVNRRGTKALPPGQTPYDALHGRPPSTADFRAFGAAAYVHLLPHQRPAGGKFTQRAVMGVMVGYCPNGAGWRIYVPAAGKVVTSGHVRFDEAVFPSTRLTGTRTDAGEDDVFPWPEENDAATVEGGVTNGPTVDDAATAEPTGARAAVASAGAGEGSGDRSGGETGAASDSGGGAGGRRGSGGSNITTDCNAGGAAAADDPAGASAAGSLTQVPAADDARGSGGAGNDSSSGGSSGGNSVLRGSESTLGPHSRYHQRSGSFLRPALSNVPSTAGGGGSSGEIDGGGSGRSGDAGAMMGGGVVHPAALTGDDLVGRQVSVLWDNVDDRRNVWQVGTVVKYKKRARGDYDIQFPDESGPRQRNFPAADHDASADAGTGAWHVATPG
ncbi:unnamed protein product, partial [Phaeothamnion confervicola]